MSGERRPDVEPARTQLRVRRYRVLVAGSCPAATGTNFWILLACSTSPVYMFPCLSVPIALIQWNWPEYLPLLPNDPSVLPVVRSRIHTLLLVPSATYIYFCCA